ncbi:MAG TPA: helix-turn-helix transcriptional regulator [Candidatus Enterenecus merdae]|nr:helix-turn-helix transcriptional regulator [Candidatus Enterenecus merdae]
MVDVGSKIKALQMSQKITQHEFALRLGVTKSAISSYENGSRLPSYHILIKISHIFKASIDDLLSSADKKAQTLSVSGLTDWQIAAVKSAIDTYRTWNAIRGQVPENMQKLLDEFVETGALKDKPVTFEE